MIYQKLEIWANKWLVPIFISAFIATAAIHPILVVIAFMVLVDIIFGLWAAFTLDEPFCWRKIK